MEVKSKTIKCACGRPDIYAKCLCRRCYKRDLLKRSPVFKQQRYDYGVKYRKANKDKINNLLSKYKADGRMKRYQRNAQLKKLYGIDIKDYDRMFSEQSGKCFICSNSRKTVLHVDHNHKTGKIRKLLCATCNFYIGMIERNETILQKVIDYIKT
jgi:hypothetical protein